LLFLALLGPAPITASAAALNGTSDLMAVNVDGGFVMTSTGSAFSAPVNWYAGLS